MTPEDVRRRIRERIESGQLPSRPPGHTQARPGTGQPCAVCDLAIAAGVEIEAHGADNRVRFYHEDCYVMLVAERARRSGNAGRDGV